MKKVITGLAAGAFMLGMVGVASATLIEVDFNTAGDGYLIHDTVNNLEWLDVTKTTSMSVNQFFTSSIYADSGFRLATESDMLKLYTEAGIATVQNDGSYYDFTSDNAPGVQLLNTLMEHVAPYSQTNGNYWVHGFMDNGIDNDNYSYISQFILRWDGVANASINTYQISSYNDDTTHGAIGIWAVRNVAPVPEPATMLLLGTGLVGFAGSRIRRKKKA